MSDKVIMRIVVASDNAAKVDAARRSAAQLAVLSRKLPASVLSSAPPHCLPEPTKIEHFARAKSADRQAASLRSQEVVAARSAENLLDAAMAEARERRAGASPSPNLSRRGVADPSEYFKDAGQEDAFFRVPDEGSKEVRVAVQLETCALPQVPQAQTPRGSRPEQPKSDAECLRACVQRIRVVQKLLADTCGVVENEDIFVLALEAGVHVDEDLARESLMTKTGATVYLTTWGVLLDLATGVAVEASGERIRLPALVQETLEATPNSNLHRAMLKYLEDSKAPPAPDGAISVLASGLPTRTEMANRLVESLVGQLVHLRRYAASEHADREKAKTLVKAPAKPPVKTELSISLASLHLDDDSDNDEDPQSILEDEGGLDLGDKSDAENDASGLGGDLDLGDDF